MAKKLKAKKPSRYNKSYEFHLHFLEVNGSIGKLVVGSTKVTKTFNGQARVPNVGAKAIDTPFSRAANDNRHDACMNAIEQLLHKARKGHDIFIFTTEQAVHDIANDSPAIDASIRARFKKFGEREISIQVANPSVLEDSEYDDLANRMARIRENNLKNHKTDARGYHR